MKVFIFMASIFILFSCQNSALDVLTGKWEVSTSAYHAIYQIQKGNHGGYDCSVLSYNDGTTVYTEDSKSHPYLFKNVGLDHKSKVDGTSGATKSNNSTSKSHEIQVINERQIKVISHLFNQEKVELWTRVK